MDRRFIQVWERMQARRESGERLQDVMKDMRTSELIAALAAAGERDAITANALATELLNRHRRRPYLGASLVSAATLLAIFLLDAIFTDTPFWVLESGTRGYLLAVLLGVIAAFSALMYHTWCGGFPALRMALERRRSF